MRILKMMIPTLAVALGLTVPLSAEFEINERDIQAISQHLKTKRDMRLSDKHDDLNISGSIAFEYKHYSEEKAGVEQRGNATKAKGTAPDGGQNEFDVEFNLYFDYTAERTWAHVHMEFENDAGVMHLCQDGNYECGSGECDQICLYSAYFGYNIFEEGTSRLDIEVGRWVGMYAIFDSRVQFNDCYDGFLLTYSNSFEDVGDFYIKGGAFVVDSVASNWGYAVEAGLVDIADLGLDLKYSFVDYAHGQDRRGFGIAEFSSGSCATVWNFRISQFSAAYHFNPEFVNEDIKVYGAFLINHSAKSSTSPAGVGKENLAWYVGLMIGGVQAEGDWAVDANYQSVEAQAVPEFGVSGIGIGNVGGNCWAHDKTAGNANYCGFQVEGAYALTDNILVIGEFEISDENSKAANMGTSRDYLKFEAELLYQF